MHFGWFWTDFGLEMMVLGVLFQCLGPILTVAACLSSKPVFLNPMDKRDEALAYDTFFCFLMNWVILI